MAATKRKRAAKSTKRPERDVTKIKNGRVSIDPIKLAAFMKGLKRKGIASPKVRFVARNAPFMRKSPV